ncbi:hypothetical protein GCM10027422_35900 [Hymenobacter arcticus]
MDATDSDIQATAPESYWTAVGNILRERPYGPGGAETRRGTRHFAPGAKVYIIDWYAGMCERIVVVGLHRSSKRMITLVIDVKLVENLRAKVCYVPAVIAKIREHYAQDYTPARIKYLTPEFAETICQTLPHWQAQPWRHASALAPAAEIPLRASGSVLHRLRLALSFLLKN